MNKSEVERRGIKEGRDRQRDVNDERWMWWCERWMWWYERWMWWCER